jgi:transposase, IS30 family
MIARFPGIGRPDLLIGKGNRSAIATLVERATGYALLVALPEGYKPEQVAPALAAKIKTLPDSLRRSLTWDQGPEMRDWKQIRVDAGIEVYFCDPHAPWQRGTNENTNGLLRQYFPKGTDLSTLNDADLDRVADELNDRPRKRLGFYKPSERIAELVRAARRQLIVSVIPLLRFRGWRLPARGGSPDGAHGWPSEWARSAPG